MSRGTRLSPTTRFALLPALVVVLLTIALLLVAHVLLVDELARRTMLRSDHRAAALARQLDDQLRGAQREVQLLARSPTVSAAAPAAAVRAELEFLRGNAPHFAWLGLVAMDGTVVAGTKGWLEGRSVATRPVFEQGRRAAWMGDVHPAQALAAYVQTGRSQTVEFVDIGEPVRDASGRTVAVLAAHLGVDWVDRLSAAATGRTEGAPVPGVSIHVLTGAAGRSVLPGTAVPDGIPSRLARPAEVQALDGQRYFAAVRELGGGAQPAPLPWRVMMLQRRDAALAPAYRVLGLMAGAGALAALGVGLLGYALARRMLRPWDPVFDAVQRRLGAEGTHTPMADDLQSVADELTHAQAREPGAPQAVAARLARDAQELRRLIERLPVGIALIDQAFRVEYLNPAYSRLLGWSTEQVRGLAAAEFLFDPIERDEFVRQYASLAEMPGELVSRFDALRPDGGRVAIQWHMAPLLDDDGRVQGAIVTVHDVRAEREARARADALAGRLRALTDAAIDSMIVTLDREGRVFEWSRGAHRLTGHSPAAALGRPLGELLAPGDGVADWLVQARREGSCEVSGEFTMAEGPRHWLEGALYALALAPGSARFGLILRDVSERRQAEQAMREGRERLERMIQTMSEGLVMTDADGRFTLLNAAALRNAGLALDQMLGRRYDEVPFKRFRPGPHGADVELQPGELAFDRLRRGEPAIHDEIVIVVRPDGVRRITSQNACPLRDENGRFAGAVLTYVDITDRYEAEQALADSQARLSAIIDSASDAIVSTDVDGRISLFNPAAERIFGRAAADMLGQPLDLLLPETQRGRHEVQMAAFARSGITRRAMGVGRVQGRRADGRMLELETSISQAVVHGQTVLTAILRDVTERMAQERALEQSRSDLTELAHRLMEQEKTTTRRLALALHDELGQTLSALRLHWEALAVVPPAQAAPLRERVGGLVVTANRQIRSVLGELRPPMLDELGLAAALDNELQQQRPVDDRPRLQLHVPQRLQLQRWPADLEYAAFMIAREALVNALQHTGAERVDVELDGDAGHLLLTVRDDGTGASPLALAGRPGHLGLVGMRERALAIGATLGLASGPGQGTVITMQWSSEDEPDLSR